MTEDQEEEKKVLNKEKPLEINRGVELLLRNRRKSKPKPKARKIRNYLYSILEDAWRYSRDRKPGRRKKDSK